MFFLLFTRHLAERRISFVKGVVSAYAGGPTKSRQYHDVGGRSLTGYTGVPDVLQLPLYSLQTL